jgi:predicted RNA-binding protein YlxR (DUF448 family)
MTERPVPQRTCVGCRSTDAKRRFVRIVRTSEGSVAVDETARKNGRGAYICERAECWEDALKRDRLARALRITISREDADALRQYGARFAPAEVAG